MSAKKNVAALAVCQGLLLLATAIAVGWLALARRALRANTAPVPSILE